MWIHQPPKQETPLRSGRTLAGSLIILIVLTLAVRCARGQALPLAPHLQVTDITPKPGWFTEPGIAINPHNPQQVVAAYQDNAHIAYSTDAGAHWTVAMGTESTRYRISGDVSTTFNNKGYAFLSYMAFDRLGTFNYWAHGAGRSGLFVRRSLDGGRTWEAKDVTIIEHPTTPGIPFEDKPYIVADTSSSPYAGNLYVGWTRWTVEDSQILLSRSTDDGQTWSAPVELTKQRGLPRDDNGAAEGFSGVVGPRGTLYAVWSLGDHIVFTTSRDGGKTFAAPKNVIETAPIMFHVQAVARANGFPVISLDPRRGKLYVAWSDYRYGEVDVFCSTSSDRGRHWTPAGRVNSGDVHSGGDHFFHWLAVDPKTGAANVIFYDRREDPGNREAKLTLARSTDGGQTFTNYALTQKAFDPGNVFMGDYTGIAAWDGRVYGVWTEKPPNPKSRDTIVRVGVADFGK